MSMINNKDDQQEVIIKESSENIPNESSGLYVRGFIKISDPETGEILVHTSD